MQTAGPEITDGQTEFVDRPLYFLDSKNRLLCSQCLRVIHRRGDPRLYAALSTIPVGEMVEVRPGGLEWKTFVNRVTCMIQYLKRREGKKFAYRSDSPERLVVMRTV